MQNEIISILVLICLSILGSIFKALKFEGWKKFVNGMLKDLRDNNNYSIYNLSEKIKKLEDKVYSLEDKLKKRDKND